MNNLIAHTQTSYIKGEYFLDNAVYAHETLHTIKVQKIKSFFIQN
jgi:hypothetical protein